MLEDFSTDAIITAMEINAQESWLRFGRWIGAKVHDEPELLWFFSGSPFHITNAIVRAQFSLNDLEHALNERIRQLAEEHVPMAWLVGPSTRPSDLGSRLQAHGWTLDDEAPGMAIDLHTLDEQQTLPPSVTIERVDDEETLRTWLRVMIVGSELPEDGLAFLLDIVTKNGFKASPDIHYYLGVLNGEPVASSLLYFGGGVAGIYCVATLPDARQKGIGTAITVAPLLDARVIGYRIGVLQSSQMGLHLYQRLGFKEYCTFHAYFWQG